MNCPECSTDGILLKIESDTKIYTCSNCGITFSNREIKPNYKAIMAHALLTAGIPRDKIEEMSEEDFFAASQSLINGLLSMYDAVQTFFGGVLFLHKEINDVFSSIGVEIDFNKED